MPPHGAARTQRSSFVDKGGAGDRDYDDYDDDDEREFGHKGHRHRDAYESPSRRDTERGRGGRREIAFSDSPESGYGSELSGRERERGYRY